MVVYQASVPREPPAGPTGLSQVTLRAVYGRLPGFCTPRTACRSQGIDPGNAQGCSCHLDWSGEATERRDLDLPSRERRFLQSPFGLCRNDGDDREDLRWQDTPLHGNQLPHVDVQKCRARSIHGAFESLNEAVQ